MTVSKHLKEYILIFRSNAHHMFKHHIGFLHQQNHKILSYILLTVRSVDIEYLSTNEKETTKVNASAAQIHSRKQQSLIFKAQSR